MKTHTIVMAVCFSFSVLARVLSLYGREDALPSQASVCPAAEIRVDAGRKVGVVRALHGVNGGPICYGGLVDVSAQQKALGIPLARIHDANWPSRDAVDIHAVFPDFKADAESPENYRFGPTDDYLKSIAAVGSGIVYRLGESIEHTPRKHYVHKPADYEQWAKVCIGVIRHCNEGWADGLHLDIRHFEIWNEPDLGLQQWDATPEDYYRLYAVTAKAIKGRFPKVKVGGPATFNAGHFKGDQFVLPPFLERFLDYCRKESAPLDFLSWHMYTADPALPARYSAALRRILDDRGFKTTEIHLNEWNYTPGKDYWPSVFGHHPERMEKLHEVTGGPAGAAFAACVLLDIQDAPLDMANFYTADHGYFGMFNFYGVPRKTYHAFRAFKALVDHPARVAVDGGKPGELNAAAGLDAAGRELAIIVSNFKSPERQIELAIRNLPWNGPSKYEVLVLDQARNLEPVRKEERPAGAFKIVQDLPAPGVMLLYVRPRVVILPPGCPLEMSSTRFSPRAW